LRCNRAGEMGRGAAGGRDGNATTGASAKIVRDINVEVGISAGTRRTIVALESLVFISPVVFENALDMNPAGTAVAAGPSIAGFLVLLFVVHVHAVWAVLIFVVLESTSITKHHRSIQDVRKPSLSPLRSFYGSAILATLLKVVNQISSQHNIRGARSVHGNGARANGGLGSGRKPQMGVRQCVLQHRRVGIERNLQSIYRQ